MKRITDRFAAVLDANVLYPFMVRDVLLTLAEARLYRPLWTNQITDEWASHLVAAKPLLSAKIADTVSTMNRAFPEAVVEGYEDLVSALNLPDPDDRHVMAAALRGGATVIITENLKDFPDKTLAEYDIEAHTADEFVLNLLHLHSIEAIAALKRMRTRYNNRARVRARVRSPSWWACRTTKAWHRRYRSG
jgi:predicted nucleic acid-binding protein